MDQVNSAIGVLAPAAMLQQDAAATAPLPPFTGPGFGELLQQMQGQTVEAAFNSAEAVTAEPAAKAAAAIPAEGDEALLRMVALTEAGAVSATDAQAPVEETPAPAVIKTTGPEESQEEKPKSGGLFGLFKDVMRSFRKVLDKIFATSPNAPAADAGGGTPVDGETPAESDPLSASASRQSSGLLEELKQRFPELAAQLNEKLSEMIGELKFSLSTSDSASEDSSADQTAEETLLKLGSKSEATVAAEVTGATEAEQATSADGPDLQSMLLGAVAVLEQDAPAQSPQPLKLHSELSGPLVPARNVAEMTLSGGEKLTLTLLDKPAPASNAGTGSPSQSASFNVALSDKDGAVLHATLEVSRAGESAQAIRHSAQSGTDAALQNSAAGQFGKLPEAVDTAPLIVAVKQAVEPAASAAPLQSAVALDAAGTEAEVQTETELAGAKSGGGLVFRETEAILTGRAQPETVVDGAARRLIAVAPAAAAQQSAPQASRLGAEAAVIAAQPAETDTELSLDTSGEAATPAPATQHSRLPGQLLEFSSTAPGSENSPAGNAKIMAERVMEHVNRFKAAGDGLYSAHLKLEPVSLGQMHVNISVRGGQVSLQIAVVSSAAREQLRESIESLRSSLTESGLTVSDLRIVELDARGGSGNSRERQQEGREADDNKQTGA